PPTMTDDFEVHSTPPDGHPPSVCVWGVSAQRGRIFSKILAQAFVSRGAPGADISRVFLVDGLILLDPAVFGIGLAIATHMPVSVIMDDPGLGMLWLSVAVRAIETPIQNNVRIVGDKKLHG